MLNMKKEIRAEIKTLKSAAKKVHRDFDREIRANHKELTLHERAIERLSHRDSVLAGRQRQVSAKLTRRILILEGRLS